MGLSLIPLISDSFHTVKNIVTMKTTENEIITPYGSRL